MRLQQSHCASAKASTRHPATKHTLHFHGCSYQLIQFPAAHFIQISDIEIQILTNGFRLGTYVR